MFDYAVLPAKGVTLVRRTRTPVVVASLQRENMLIGSLHTDRPDVSEVSRHAPMSDLLTLAPGQVAGLSGIPGLGMTRLGLSLIAPYADAGSLACIDVRGWLNPAAAWELGINPERLVVVRNGDLVTWGRVVATLLGGLRAVYAEVPIGVKDVSLRKLAAKARAQRTPLVLRPLVGELPRGIAHLHLNARGVVWEGTDAGHGTLKTRRTVLDASGKATRGREQTIEVDDEGRTVFPVIGSPTTRSEDRAS